MLNYQLIVGLKYGIYGSLTFNERTSNNYVQFQMSIDSLEESICIVFHVLFAVT